MKMYPSESLQIVHMGWACECPEGSAPGRSSTFKFLSLRGPYFYIFKSPPVICFFNFPIQYGEEIGTFLWWVRNLTRVGQVYKSFLLK